MDEVRQRYIEDFGVLFGGFGMPRMVGRTLAVLLISDPPERTAEELANLLQASRGSISQATRMLEPMGLIQRVSRRGERRDYFRVKPDAWHELMRRELESLAVFREMAEKGLELMKEADPEAKRGLREMWGLYDFWERELPSLLERYESEEQGD